MGYLLFSLLSKGAAPKEDTSRKDNSEWIYDLQPKLQPPVSPRPHGGSAPLTPGNIV